jgi:hypothetical protein
MSGIYQASLPTSEPVAVSDALNYCKVFTAVTSPPNAEYTLVQALITAARVYIENATGLMLAPRNYVQSLDCFPFYPYSREPYGQLYGVGALSLYFGYGPILPTPIPPYGQTFNGHLPFEIVLLGNPVTAVDHIEYLDSTGTPQVLKPGQDFTVDMTSFPARVMPMPSSVWPQCSMSANSVQIFFTAGYNQNPTTIETVSDTAGTTESGDTPPTPPEQQTSYTFVTGIPQDLYVAILMLTMHFYENRGAVSGGSGMEIPHGVQAIIDMNKVLDFSVGLSTL